MAIRAPDGANNESGLCWANIDIDNDKLALCCANMEKIIINQVCVGQILIMIHLGSVGQVWIMIMIDWGCLGQSE